MALRNVAVALAVLVGAVSQTWAEGLRNLAPVEKPRFAIKDRDWPAEPGDASVCLWSGDQLAAVSFTIDDNTAPDHDWWREAGEKYGFRFTWFVITGRVSGSNKFFGTWAGFEELRQRGHDIQSHTVDHFSAKPGPSLPVDQNYSESIKQLEAGLPGAKCLTLAYPGGAGGTANNDVNVAAKYFIAARGARGQFNFANQINYIQTNSIGGVPSLDPANRVGLPRLIDPNVKPALVYRAWASVHFHGLQNPNDPPGKTKSEIITVLDYLKANSESFWMAPFTHVAQYGQERDTAELRCESMGEAQWKITVTDRMDDALFDFPLTVKLRLPEGSSNATAKQGEKNTAVRIVENSGAKFALVEVIPDRGPVIVTAGKN